MPSSDTAIPTTTEALRRIAHRHVLVGHRSAHRVQRIVELHLIPAFGDRLITSLSTADMEQFAAQLRANGKAPGTINLILDPLRTLFKLYSKPDELGDRLRPPHIPFLSVRNARERCFNRADFERCVTELAEPLRAPLWFAYYSGWRVRSEVLWLRWDQHVNWDRGIVTITAREDKNAQSKIFPFDILPDFAALMQAQRARMLHGCPWLFHRFGGHRIVAFERAWRAAVCRALCGCGAGAKLNAAKRYDRCERRNGADFVPHDLRRTAARNLREAGVEDKVIMDIVGWRTITMLHRYLGHSRESDVRSAVGKLARVGIAPITPVAQASRLVPRGTHMGNRPRPRLRLALRRR